MYLEKHTLKEKFEMLSFIQKKLPIGSFIITRLKRTEKYQLSFINGNDFKVQSDCIEDIVDQALEEFILIYEDNTRSDFYYDFILQSEREIQYTQSKQILEQNKIIQDLKDKVKELEDNYSKDLVKTGFCNGITKTFIPDDGKGFISDGEISPTQEELGKLMKHFEDVISDLKKEFPGGSKLFSEYELYVEIIRKNDNFNTVDDVINFKKGNPKDFKNIRLRAYDTLYKRKKKNNWK